MIDLRLTEYFHRGRQAENIAEEFSPLFHHIFHFPDVAIL
ncbi:hypothetical protein STW0522KLE44_30460 [Klebsiella sp. STW0522-44]|nr:hypothetical protein STW0522KLE44_30460 [Klebsiella sp. STW0522-44]